LVGLSVEVNMFVGDIRAVSVVSESERVRV
jgi:hypothetical protein